MATQAQRTATMRGRILSAAEMLFARDGYDETSTDDIVAETKISRGALYHHFPTKRSIFEAVFLKVSEQAIARALSGGEETSSPLEAVIQASLRWLEEARDPRVAAILIDQGPRVLGWQRARDLEARSSLRLVMGGLDRAVDAGEIRIESTEVTARMLNAVMAEAALVSLQSQPVLSVATTERAVRQFANGLRHPVDAFDG